MEDKKDKNAGLQAAKDNPKDEFYTQLEDIEKEMRHYRQHFRGKTVICNADDPFESNFFKFFVLNFNKLGLKKLIATSYTDSPIQNRELRLFYEGDKDGEYVFPDPGRPPRKAYKAVITTVYDKNRDGALDMADIAELFKSKENTLEELKGSGSFDSAECLALLDEADICVTNPPFSRFRDFVNTLMEHGKDFIILGNVNAITYKEFFPYLQNDQVWIGPSIHSGDRKFYVPDSYPLNAAGCGVDETGKRFIRVKGVRWFTTLDVKQRHEEMYLVKWYNPEEYPHYDNYAAINVDRTVDIPRDWPEVIGVPITFLDKYSPDQFEIIGFAGGWSSKSPLVTRKYPTKQTQHNKNGSKTSIGKMNDGTAYLCVSQPPAGKTYSTVGDGKYYLRTYGRILIRHKHPEEPRK